MPASLIFKAILTFFSTNVYKTNVKIILKIPINKTYTKQIENQVNFPLKTKILKKQQPDTHTN